MGLYQRGRVWHVSYQVNGRQIQETTGTRNRREAERFYALRVSEVERGVYAKVQKISFAEFGKRYIEHARSHKRSWLRDEQMLNRLNAFFDNAMLSDINPLRVEQYQQARVKEVCPATVNRETALLKHMLNLAERWELRQGSNPVRFIKFLPENNLKFQTLSEEDERALLSRCPPYLQDMVLFAINTGLRCGDIFDLKWEEVDLDGRRLNIVMEKSRKPLLVPINDAAFKILSSWKAMKKGPYVFYNHMTGDRFRDLKAGLKQACKQAGLKHVTWHMFRHTFASRLIQNGTDIVTVKELLGHSTVVVTMRYAHTNEEAKVKAVDGISYDRSMTVVPKPRRKMISQSSDATVKKAVTA